MLLIIMLLIPPHHWPQAVGCYYNKQDIRKRTIDAEKSDPALPFKMPMFRNKQIEEYKKYAQTI
tara:strand:- start:33 stop:224 length:192 start_codon:yes stop_codon:yes gene_type:complete